LALVLQQATLQGGSVHKGISYYAAPGEET
jgi:hypothetical protein